MKYEETCTCGAKMKFEAEKPAEIARTKAQWKIDHETHGNKRAGLERKRLVREYQEWEARAKAAEDQAYPAMVVAYNLQVGDKKKGTMLYEATLHPGNGFYWEDPATNIIISLAPTTMKLTDIEDKPTPPNPHSDHIHANTSNLQASVPSGDKAPPSGSVLDNNRLTTTPRELWANHWKEQKAMGVDEQREQSKSKRDSGATPPKAAATRSRIRRNDVGRRGNQRQG